MNAPIRREGSKAKLATKIAALLPAGVYHEPFLGGGSVFLRHRPERAYLSDNDERVVNLWLAAQNDLNGLLGRLQTHRQLSSREHFMRVKANPTHAADWWYLWRTSYYSGGNSYCKTSSHWSYRPGYWRALHYLLRNATIACQDYTRTDPQPGDVVYLDPPYLNAQARKYPMFGEDETAELFKVARDWRDNGVRVFISNCNEARRFAADWKVEAFTTTYRMQNRLTVTELLCY